MKNYLFLDDAQYIPNEVYNWVVNGFPEAMKGSGTPITITCTKPKYYGDCGFIRETSPGIYPLQQKEYIKRNNISNDKDLKLND